MKPSLFLQGGLFGYYPLQSLGSSRVITIIRPLAAGMITDDCGTPCNKGHSAGAERLRLYININFPHPLCAAERVDQRSVVGVSKWHVGLAKANNVLSLTAP